MHVYARAVQRHRLQLDAHDLLALQVLEYTIQHPALRPAVHARVEGVPGAKPLQQTGNLRELGRAEFHALPPPPSLLLSPA